MFITFFSDTLHRAKLGVLMILIEFMALITYYSFRVVLVMCLALLATCTVVPCCFIGACIAPFIHAFVYGFKISWKMSKFYWNDV